MHYRSLVHTNGLPMSKVVWRQWMYGRHGRIKIMKGKGMRPAYNRVSVRVPATSANLGSGFDTVGLALDFHDELTLSVSDDPSNQDVHVYIHGEGEQTLPRDETHLVVTTFRKACQTFGLGRFGFTLEAHNHIPQARGMGSSAEAIVAGISAAAALAHGHNIDRQSIFEMAAGIEGHPDNVAPAVFGGLTVSWKYETAEGVGSVVIAGGEPLQAGFHTCLYPVDESIHASVFIPDVELSTERAREALPKTIAYHDAVFNISRVALLPAAMNPQHSPACEGANALLFAATQDSMHQPYRKALMPKSWSLIEKLRRHGFAAAVSGAGPCVLVLHYGQAEDDIERICAQELSSEGWSVLHLPVNSRGVEVDVQ